MSNDERIDCLRLALALRLAARNAPRSFERRIGGYFDVAIEPLLLLEAAAALETFGKELHAT